MSLNYYLHLTLANIITELTFSPNNTTANSMRDNARLVCQLTKEAHAFQQLPNGLLGTSSKENNELQNYFIRVQHEQQPLSFLL